MDKIKIKIITVGKMPFEFKKKKILKWKSSIFKISDEIESFSLTRDSDRENWEYSDNLLEKEILNNFSEDLLIAIVNVPIVLNWFVRRLNNNRIIFTYNGSKEIFLQNNIPLENAIFLILYKYSLVYKRYNNKILTNSEYTNFTHDETRGCLFDMNGNKWDIIFSCHKPIICSECIERLKKENISNELITKVQKDISKIKKPPFYQITDFIKKHPIWSIIISTITAIIFSGIGSYIANWLFTLNNK